MKHEEILVCRGLEQSSQTIAVDREELGVLVERKLHISVSGELKVQIGSVPKGFGVCRRALRGESGSR